LFVLVTLSLTLFLLGSYWMRVCGWGSDWWSNVRNLPIIC
jgi:hypothetical protein